MVTSSIKLISYIKKAKNNKTIGLSHLLNAWYVYKQKEQNIPYFAKQIKEKRPN